ncbi:winged helix-turn-helix transcriptional regulator [bacterium]|nr:MAG: winged helix-turn-helix transcriptional regulator [bacterium]
MSELCDEIEKLGKGIGNASRYKIVEALFNEAKTVGQLVKAVKISQSAMSQHLKTLKLYNIVIDERKGQEVYYRLNAEYTLKLLKSLSDGIKQQAKKGK